MIPPPMPNGTHGPTPRPPSQPPPPPPPDVPQHQLPPLWCDQAPLHLQQEVPHPHTTAWHSHTGSTVQQQHICSTAWHTSTTWDATSARSASSVRSAPSARNASSARDASSVRNATSARDAPTVYLWRNATPR